MLDGLATTALHDMESAVHRAEKRANGSGTVLCRVCEMAPWKKVLGFKITVNESDGTVQMSCEAVIETMYRTYLKGQLTYDAKLPMRDVELESGVVLERRIRVLERPVVKEVDLRIPN